MRKEKRKKSHSKEIVAEEKGAFTALHQQEFAPSGCGYVL